MSEALVQQGLVESSSGGTDGLHAQQIAKVGETRDTVALKVLQQKDPDIQQSIERAQGVLMEELPDKYEEIESICGSDQRRWMLFTLLAKAKSQEVISIIVKNRDAYENNSFMLEEILKTNIHDSALEKLFGAKHIYAGNFSMFSKFIYVAKKGGADRLHFLTQANIAYGSNMDMFDVFAELSLESDGLNRVIFLTKIADVYGQDMEKFEQYVEIARSRYLNTVKLFPKLKSAAGNTADILQVLREFGLAA